MKEKYVIERLHEWADFFGRVQTNIGYPHLSIEGKLQRDGGLLPRGTKSIHDPMPSNPAAEEIETLWKELSKENYGRAYAVKKKYFSHANTSTRTLAREAGISLRVFQKRLLTGEKWFEAKLQKKNIVSEFIFLKAA
jgi:hypothetical protein